MDRGQIELTEKLGIIAQPDKKLKDELLMPEAHLARRP